MLSPNAVTVTIYLVGHVSESTEKSADYTVIYHCTQTGLLTEKYK